MQLPGCAQFIWFNTHRLLVRPGHSDGAPLELGAPDMVFMKSDILQFLDGLKFATASTFAIRKSWFIHMMELSTFGCIPVCPGEFPGR
jgi:hypothetical protein